MSSGVIAESPRSDGDTAGSLTVGFYHLTLCIAFLATAEVRVRVSGALPSFTVLELATFPVVLCLVCESLLRPAVAEQLGVLYRRNRPVAWYAGWAALAALLGMSRLTDTLQALKDLPPSLLLYALIFLTVTTQTRVAGLLIANLAGALLNVGLGLLQVTVGGPHPTPPSPYIEYKLDLAGNFATQVPIGFFSHPNGLAVYLIPVILFIGIATWPGLARARQFGVGKLGLLAVILLVFEMTFAKGAFAWLAAGFIFLALPRRLDRWRLFLAVFIVVVGICGLIWFSIQALLAGQSSFGTMAGRAELWLAAVQVIRGDGFVALFGSGAPSVASQDLDYANAHNAWLNQALSYGLPALAFYLAAFWVALRSLGQAVLSMAPPQRTVALAAMASLMALLGEYFFEPMDGGVVYKTQLFTLLALATVYRCGPAQTAPSAVVPP